MDKRVCCWAAGRPLIKICARLFKKKTKKQFLFVCKPLNKLTDTTHRPQGAAESQQPTGIRERTRGANPALCAILASKDSVA